MLLNMLRSSLSARTRGSPTKQQADDKSVCFADAPNVSGAVVEGVRGSPALSNTSDEAQIQEQVAPQQQPTTGGATSDDRSREDLVVEVDVLRAEVASLRAQISQQQLAREELAKQQQLHAHQQQQLSSPSRRMMLVDLEVAEDDGSGRNTVSRVKGLISAADSFKIGTPAVPGSKDRTWHFRSKRSKDRILRTRECSRRRRGQPAVSRDQQLQLHSCGAGGDLVLSPSGDATPSPKPPRNCFF